MSKEPTKKKREEIPRYDDAFRQGAVRMVTEQKLPIPQVASELGICVDTLRSWLKKKGLNPVAENRSNTLTKKVHELEARVRNLQKQLKHKDEVIDTLKKSIGIISNP